MTASNVDPLLGTMVGRYRISHVIGHGGMGRVYAAEHPELGSRVAIKVIAEEHAQDRDLTDRFFAEARAVARIRHDSIVNVIDLQRLADGRPVIVMELIDGQTLRAILHEGRPPIGGVVAVMAEVLSALAAAHAVDIVHRDLKPDNILVTPGGRAKVLDFGIAKLMSPAPGQLRTRTGVVLGTPEYMAPEQISGGVVDRRCDVYAAGVVLFEALTGRRPFDGPTDFDVMRHHVDTPPPSLRRLRPEIPIELEQVILCALAKRPSERFGNAIAMANALSASSATLPGEEWRSLTPSALPLRRPAPFAMPPEDPATRADRPETVVTHNEKRGSRGRLDGATLPAVPSPAPRRPSQPSGAPPTRDAAALETRSDRAPRPRSPWLVPVLAALGGAGVVAAVVAISSARGEKASAPPAPASAPVPAPVSVLAPVGNGMGWSKVVPHGEDPSQFDPMSYVERATALARTAAPDAQLSMLRASNVGPGGTIDVSAESALYVFRSAAGIAKGTCIVTVTTMKTTANVMGPGHGGCAVVELAPPRCTMVQVLERARQRAKMPTLVATLSLHRVDEKTGQWWLVVSPGTSTMQIVDDCGVDPEPARAIVTKPESPRVVPADAGAAAPVVDAPPKARPDPVVGWTGGFGKWADYNPRRFDVIAYLARAQVLAREMSSDAKLVSIRADNVTADGLLTIRRGADLRLDFRGTQKPCGVAVMPTIEHVVIGPTDAACSPATRGLPTCTFPQIWKRALAAEKIPDLPAGTVASLRWNNSGNGRWTFSLADDALRRKYNVGDIDLDDSCGMHGSP